MTPPEGRVTPAREERGPALTAAPPAISQPRQVSLRAAPPEPLSTLKQNKRSLFCAARLRSYGKNSIFPAARRAQQRLWEMCVTKTGNSLCFLWLERASHFQVDCQRVRADIYTCGHRAIWVKLDTSATLLPDRRIHWNTVASTVPKCAALRLLRARFQRSTFSPHLSHFISNYKNDTLPHREQLQCRLQRLLSWSWELSGHYNKKRAAAASINPNMGWKATLAPWLTHLDDVVVQVFWVAVDQVNLFSVDILHRLLVQAVVVHIFVVRFVYVSLFSDERRMQELLSGSRGGRERMEWGGGIVCGAEREGDWSCVLPACPTSRDGFKWLESEAPHPLSHRKGSSSPEQTLNWHCGTVVGLTYQCAWKHFKSMRKRAKSCANMQKVTYYPLICCPFLDIL